MLIYISLILLFLSILLIYLGFLKSGNSKKYSFIGIGNFFLALLIWINYVNIRYKGNGIPSSINYYFIAVMFISVCFLSASLLYWVILPFSKGDLNKAPYKITSLYTTAISVITLWLFNSWDGFFSYFFPTIPIVILIGFALYRINKAFDKYEQYQTNLVLNQLLPDETDLIIEIRLGQHSASLLGQDETHFISHLFYLKNGTIAFPESSNDTRYLLTKVDFTPKYESEQNDLVEVFSTGWLMLQDIATHQQINIKCYGFSDYFDNLRELVYLPQNSEEDLTIDDLPKLKALLDNDVITQDDFDKKKKEILKL